MIPKPRPKPDSVRPRPKILLWDRNQETETEASMINSIARESKTNRYALLSNIYYIGYLK